MQVIRCPRGDLLDYIAEADVLVPLMTHLDSKLLQAAQKARLILQYGVGLEGVDIPAVRICFSTWRILAIHCCDAPWSPPESLSRQRLLLLQVINGCRQQS